MLPSLVLMLLLIGSGAWCLARYFQHRTCAFFLFVGVIAALTGFLFTAWFLI